VNNVRSKNEALAAATWLEATVLNSSGHRGATTAALPAGAGATHALNVAARPKAGRASPFEELRCAIDLVIVTPIGEPEKFGPVGVNPGIVMIRQLHATGLNQARGFNQAHRFVADRSNANNPTADTLADVSKKRMPGPGPLDQNDAGAISISQLDCGGPQCRVVYRHG
jgi:hypothetical protein